MSATMARQGGRVKLELSNMLLAGNMANMTNGGFSCAAIEETQHLMKKPRPKVQEERKQRVVIPAHRNVKAAKERQPAMLLENNTNRCVTCQNGTVKNPQTWWRRIGMAAAVPDWHRQQTPEPTPTLPWMLHAPPGENQGAQRSQTVSLPAIYSYLHAPLPNVQCFNHDAYAKDSKHDKDSIPDLLTEEGTSTG